MPSGEPRRRVRLRDVADKAGVSSTTASFVLGGRDMRSSEQTLRRVLRASGANGQTRQDQRRDERPSLRHGTPGSFSSAAARERRLAPSLPRWRGDASGMAQNRTGTVPISAVRHALASLG